jgi:hypothetical protein
MGQPARAPELLGGGNARQNGVQVMNLLPEQCAALALFLGHDLIDTDIDVQVHTGLNWEWGGQYRSDADLTMSLVERAMGHGYWVELHSPTPSYGFWRAQFHFRNRDNPAYSNSCREEAAETTLEAVALAVLQLPEAAEPQNTVRSNAWA